MLEIFPDSPYPYLEMSKLHEKRNDRAAAEQSIKNAIDKDPENPDLHVVMARFFEKYGKILEAENSYRTAISLAKRPLDYRALLADFFFNQEQLAQAQEQLNQVLGQYPNHLLANFVKAKLLLRDDNVIRGIGTARKPFH